MRKLRTHHSLHPVAGLAAALSLGLGLMSAPAHSHGPEFHLLLAGGSLNTCSAAAPGRCEETDWIDPATMYTGPQLAATDAARERLADAVGERSGLSEAQWDTLAPWLKAHSDEQWQPDAFTEALRDDHEPLYQDLSDAQWYRLLDELEQPVGERTEQVQLNLSKEPEGGDIVHKFVEMAASVSEREDNPKISIITASARDALEPVSFYLELFAAAGAQVHWLPLDAVVHEAMQHDRCDQLEQIRADQDAGYNRTTVHPELTARQQDFCTSPQAELERLAAADGVFFNGGDQSRTRAALMTESDEPGLALQIIQHALEEGTMVAGGTSAGTAVMPAAAMISNGTSAAALRKGAHDTTPPPLNCDREGTCPDGLSADSLTYTGSGGIGLFPFGITDTHFTERGRHARVMQLGAETGADLVVGVDETTALLVNISSGRSQVIGKHGVFIAWDLMAAEGTVAGHFSYLLPGSLLQLTDQGVQQVQFDGHRVPRASEPETDFMTSTGFLPVLEGICRTDEDVIEAGHDGFQLVVQRNEDTTYWETADHCQVHKGLLGFSAPE